MGLSLMRAAVTQKPVLLRQWFFAKAFSRQAQAESDSAMRAQLHRKPMRRPAKCNPRTRAERGRQKARRLSRLPKAA